MRLHNAVDLCETIAVGDVEASLLIDQVSGNAVSGDIATVDKAVIRASFAKAMTSTDNPLFWRSIANRVWQWTFGKPIVGTPNDFGRIGGGTDAS